jgi:hypothetical protein
MLNESNNQPLSRKRKEHFQGKKLQCMYLRCIVLTDRNVTGLRKNHVPRYLFRAWQGASGGGPASCLNTTAGIVPRLFMPGSIAEHERNFPSFYRRQEIDLYRMASTHYDSKSSTMTGFSSWAASLHLTLCYARFLKVLCQSNTVHAAVMDTRNLEDEVLVWHAPDLIGGGPH